MIDEEKFNKQSYRCPASVVVSRDSITCRMSGEECCIDYCPMMYWMPLFFEQLANLIRKDS